jgi:hypothetical protein
MNDRKNVSKFPGRRSEVSKAVGAAIMQDQPQMGGSQGEFVREKCGTCLSWRRDSRAGQGGVPLNAGLCMFGPPTPCPVLGDQGQMLGCMMVRPPVTSDNEGCDQHDDGTDETEGDGEPASLLASAG